MGSFPGWRIYWSVVGKINMMDRWDLLRHRVENKINSSPLCFYIPFLFFSFLFFSFLFFSFLFSNTSSRIILSEETTNYDISTSYDWSWYSLRGTPMDVYFFGILITRMTWTVISIWMMEFVIYHPIVLITSMMEVIAV